MTASEKGAVLLLSLPAPAAEAILGHLRAEHGSRLRADMQRLEASPTFGSLRDQVLGEFDAILNRLSSPAAAGSDNALLRVMAEQATEPFARATSARNSGNGSAKQPDAAAPPAEPPPARDEVLRDPLGCLPTFPVDRLALALCDEQPRTGVVVLQPLEPKRAGEILRLMPMELRKTITLQLGQAAKMPPEIVNRTVQATLLKALGKYDPPPDETEAIRHKNMADLLRALDKLERGELLTSLEQQDAEFAAGVKEFLYQFEDLLRLEGRAVQKLLSEIETRDLALALRGAPEKISDKVLENLSKRARELLSEEMDLLAKAPADQVEQARKAITQVIQRMVEKGEAELSTT
jgi:flagellar motor switch protein FliG